jgi:hypothetical protein
MRIGLNDRPYAELADAIEEFIKRRAEVQRVLALKRAAKLVTQMCHSQGASSNGADRLY